MTKEERKAEAQRRRELKERIKHPICQRDHDVRAIIAYAEEMTAEQARSIRTLLTAYMKP